MISLIKLRTLCPNHRYRKIAKELLQYETNGDFPLPRIADLVNLLLEESVFQEYERVALSLALAALEDEAGRSVNCVRHLLTQHIGVVEADWDFVDTEGRLDRAARRPFPGMRLFLEDIRSPFNVGSIFRSAEIFGVEKIYVSPLSASPLHPRALRSAKGCVEVLDWEIADLERVIEKERAEGTAIFALETGGTSLEAFSFPARGILLIGSEELGLSPAARAVADTSAGRVTIPCYGLKGSLNVSVAAGIALQQWALTLRTNAP